MKAMEWIKSNIHPHGGVRGWAGGKPYPEVSGYLIPTLINWDEYPLALELANWLVMVQNEDGSFNGIDGIPRTFDTAACWEGLKTLNYHQEADRAKEWLMSMQEDGEFWIDNEKEEKNIYTLRINGILGIDLKLPDQLWPNRTHYIAYALEGAWDLGYFDWVIENLKWLRAHIRNGIAPYEFSSEVMSIGTDLCATAQLGCLFVKAGMGDYGTLAALGREVTNGYWNSWTAKYHLDLWKVIGD